MTKPTYSSAGIENLGLLFFEPKTFFPDQIFEFEMKFLDPKN